MTTLDEKTHIIRSENDVRNAERAISHNPDKPRRLALYTKDMRIERMAVVAIRRQAERGAS